MTKTSKWAEFLCVLLLVLLVAVFFREVLTSGKLIHGQDIVQQGYPFQCFTHTCLMSGDLPDWNPYMMGGMATYSSSPFGLLDSINYLAGPRIAVNMMYVLFTLLGCVSMFALMRRWGVSRPGALIAGLAFALSGFFTTKIFAGHGAAFTSGMWIPLVFLLLDLTIERRKLWTAALLGGVFGLQILGQHPQYVFYTFLAMVAFAVYRLAPLAVRPLRAKLSGRHVGLFALAGVLAVGVAAAYLAPFAELTSLSNRGGGTDYGFASSLSLPPSNLITAYAPDFWGSPAFSNSVRGSLYWDAVLYIGIAPLVLTAIGFVYTRRAPSRYLKWLAIAAVLLALGDNIPLYRVVYHIPGFNFMRVPAKALILYSFAMAALAGYGFDAARGMSARQKRKVGVALTILTCAAGIGFVAYLATKPLILDAAERMIRATRSDPDLVLRKLPGLYALQVREIGVAFLLLGITSWLLIGVRARNIAPAALVALTFVDLAIFGAPLIKTVDPAVVYGGNKAEIAFLRRQPGHFRVLPLDRERFIYAQGMMSGIQNVNGYYPLYLRRLGEYASAVNNQPMKVCVTVDFKKPQSRLLDMLNVKYVLSSKPLCHPNLRSIMRHDLYLYERETLPRAWFVHRTESASDGDSALERIQASTFDPRQTVVLEAAPSNPTASFDGMREDVRIMNYRPREIEVYVNAMAPGYLVMSEIYYPGWQAVVDGKPTKIHRANYLFRAVYLPAGSHSVVFKYDPLLRRAAAKVTGISMLTVVALCGYALLPTLRRRITGA